MDSTIVWSPVFIRDTFVDDAILVSMRFHFRTLPLIGLLGSWDLNSKGVFTVKSYYLKVLPYSSFVIQFDSLGRFPWKII